MDTSSFSWERFGRIQPNSSGRKNEQMDSVQDLFVFGYSCKLYRDDDKARRINSGEQLIPWMGQHNLMIDRYDARGYLNDLSQYDSQCKTNSNALDQQEIDFENRLNSERFNDLNYDDDIEEEDTKHSSDPSKVYSNVGFQYEDNETKSEQNNLKNEVNKEKFIAPCGLNIPDDIIKPNSNKLHSIIEKTALFVSEQGPQMEILLKTKQASNSTFNFLSIDSKLYPYFKFVLSQIKSGKYTPDQNNSNDDDSSNEDSDSDNYLHPSLLASKKQNNTNEKLQIPTLFSVKQDNDSYSQLVKHFKDKFASDIEPETIEDFSQNDESKSDSDSKTDISSLIPKPDSEMEVIITKLAQHVGKNGEGFESSIKALQDKKFEFLNNGHLYHPYYVQQKIKYINEYKKDKLQNTKQDFSSTSQKLIAFSINSKVKNNSKTHSFKNELEQKDEKENYSNESILSKEKQLQEERKKKVLNFLNKLRKDNKLDDSPNRTFGPNLPSQPANIELSPTIEAVTSPLNSPERDVLEDKLLDKYDKSSKLKTSQSILPFICKDDQIKESSPLNKRSYSPPRRYRLNDDKRYSKHKTDRSSRKHRDRSLSRERSKHRRRSKSRKDSHRERSHRNHHSRRHSSPSHSRSRSRSQSSSPKISSKRHTHSRRLRSFSSRSRSPT